MSEICTKYGCDFQVDLDGQTTCSSCGAKDSPAEPEVFLKFGIKEKH